MAGGLSQILHFPVLSKEYERRIFSLLASQDIDFIIFIHYCSQNPFSFSIHHPSSLLQALMSQRTIEDAALFPENADGGYLIGHCHGNKLCDKLNGFNPV